MRTRSAVALGLSLFLLGSLTACAQSHATIDDCVNSYLAMGKDPSVVVEVCTTIMVDSTQEEFDSAFLP